MRTCLFLAISVLFLMVLCTPSTQIVISPEEEKRIEKVMAQRKAEFERREEASEKQLPRALQALAQNRSMDRMSVAREVVKLVPTLRVDTGKGKEVQLVIDLEVTVPEYQPPSRGRGDLRERHRKQRLAYKEKVEEICLASRESAIERSQAQRILTTLASHEIPLIVFITRGQEPMEVGIFDPEDVMGVIKTSSVPPGDPLTFLKTRELYRTLKASWPEPPKFIVQGGRRDQAP